MLDPTQHPELRHPLSARVVSALSCALARRGCRLRAGGSVARAGHLLRVTGFVIEVRGDEDEVIAALCHDMTGEQGELLPADELESRFGARVRAIVEACADGPFEPGPEWRARTEARLARLETADRSALLVTAADTLDETLSMVDGIAAEEPEALERLRDGFDDLAWYFTAMYELFDRRFALGDPARALVRRLGREAQQITQARRIAELGRTQPAGA